MPRRVPDIAKIRALVGYRPTVELDEILHARHRVFPAARRPAARVDDTMATIAHSALTGTRARRAESRAAPPGQAGPAAAARDRPRSRAPSCPRSSRSRARTSATRSACSARATRCTAGRASWTSICSRRSSTSAPTLGITHVRVHNYGEPFLDRQLVEKVRYAKQKGIREVGMISNGSLITEEVARGMIEAGLDAINISVDAAGKEVFESHAHRPQLRQGHRQHRAARAHPRRAGQAPAEADPVVRAPEQLGRRAGVHRALARRSPTRSTSPTCTTGPAR